MAACQPRSTVACLKSAELSDFSHLYRRPFAERDGLHKNYRAFRLVGRNAMLWAHDAGAQLSSLALHSGNIFCRLGNAAGSCAGTGLRLHAPAHRIARLNKIV
jgi:hypothetical protein